MGTKENPGQYDAYKKADPDEQMFTLIGRDRMAPSLVDLWALAREAGGDEDEAPVIKEARDTASFMRNDLYLRRRKEIRVLDVVPLAYLESICLRRRADLERLHVAAQAIVVESGFGGLGPLDHVNGHEQPIGDTEGGDPA
jgi:hypothetical protein